MARDPLTERYAHELREVDPDPRDWMEGPYRNPDEMIVLVIVVCAIGAVAFAGWLAWLFWPEGWWL